FGNVHSGVPELNGTQFALTSCETNTTVTIIPSFQTGTHAAGVPFSITLTNRGDCYQLRGTNDSPSEVTGTIILADKPVGVFRGHQVANVASSDPFFADHLVEQLPPVNRWGAEFYTTPLETRTGGDTFRVVAGYDNTTVTINTSTVVTLLAKGSFHE